MVIQDEELRRLESRSRQVAAVVLVAMLFAIVIAAVLWLPTMTSPKSAVWDWLSDRHPELIVVLVVAGIVFGVVVAVAWRESSWRTLVWGVAPLAVIAMVLAGWSLADHRSNIGDITNRVHEVTAGLPPSASPIAASEDDNFRTETYVIHEPPDAVGRSLLASAREQLDSSARAHRGEVVSVGTGSGGGDTPPQIYVSFTGRNGCDGLVQVTVNLAPADDGTTADINGSCED